MLTIPISVEVLPGYEGKSEIVHRVPIKSLDSRFGYIFIPPLPLLLFHCPRQLLFTIFVVDRPNKTMYYTWVFRFPPLLCIILFTFVSGF